MRTTSFHPSRSLLGISTCCLVAIGLIACGGGGDSGSAAPAATDGTRTATSFTSGSISGFGSVIVGGVRFNDDNANVLDDDGTPRSRDDLQLGVTVEIEGGDVSSDDRGSHGIAHRIHFHSALVGPAGTVDTTADTLTVLGEPVKVTDTTFFDARLPQGLASVKAGDVIEVHGVRDSASGQYIATRIAPRLNATYYKVRATISELNTSARTFRMGNQVVVDYNAVPRNAFPALADGALVSAKLAVTPVQGVWQATQLAVVTPHRGSHHQAMVHGKVTAVTADGGFSVDGVAVDMRNVTLSDAEKALLKVGAEVLVRGVMTDGVLVAASVKFKGRDESDRREAFELHGAITALDLSAKTFTLRGITVDFSAADLRWKDGQLSDLSLQRRVEVKGRLSANRNTLVATSIEFED